jgi:glycerol-3-phosphate O-acyltransferase
LPFFKGIQEAIAHPFDFQPFHRSIRSPFDYYQWGNEFLLPLIILERSRLVGAENALKIPPLLAQGHNVVLLSNHQTEADPQVLSILLELASPSLGALAERVVFVAGHKVTSDPVAVPFSLGRNLLCIHSKKHIRNPPEDVPRKTAQNLDSMKALGQLASQGGQVFWVAPSGGRDRPRPAEGGEADGADNEYVVAPFDLKALDMFKLIAMQSQKVFPFFLPFYYSLTFLPFLSSQCTFFQWPCTLTN